MVLDIGGVRLGFSVRRSLPEKLFARYARFIVSGRPDVILELGGKEKHENPFTPSVGMESGCVRLKRGDFDCLLDKATGAGRLNLHPSAQAFDSFLRTFYSHMLLSEGGMLLHCAALLKNGRAYIFPGKSGAGKSTISKLAAAAGMEIISDELNLLRFENGRFRVYGSPFWGEMRNEGRRGVWPLERIFVIRKARSHRVSGIERGEALSVLLRCLMNFSRTPDAATAALANTVKLLVNVPVRRLEFSKLDAGFLGLLRK